MTNLEVTLLALQGKLSRSLGRKPGECLALIRTAIALLPQSQAAPASPLVFSVTPARDIPGDLWPDGLTPGGPEAAPEVPQAAPEETPEETPEGFQPEQDPKVLETLDDLDETLRGYLGSPVIRWADLRADLRETVKALGELRIDPVIPPLIFQIRW